MLVEIAKLWRAKFRKMRRLGGGRKFWGKRRINRIYSQHSGKPESYERTVYGVLLMVVIEASSGKVVDIWFHPASFHEKRSLRIRIFKNSDNAKALPVVFKAPMIFHEMGHGILSRMAKGRMPQIMGEADCFD